MPAENGLSNLKGIALGLALVPAVPGLFSAANPSLFTIATFSDEDMLEHTTYWIQRGNYEAIAQSALLGVGASIYSGSWWPFVLIMAMAAWKWWSYEQALKAVENGKGAGLKMTDGAVNDVKGT